MTGLPGLAAAYAREVLGALVDLDSRSVIMLTLAEPSELLPDASGRDVDDALLEAHQRNLLVGDRGEGDGSVAWWSRVRLTPDALRMLGQWPPAGREWEPGLWDTGYWGQRARPLLSQLHDDPPAHDYLFKPTHEGSETSADWTAVLLLGDARLYRRRSPLASVQRGNLRGRPPSFKLSPLEMALGGHLAARPTAEAPGRTTSSRRPLDARDESPRRIATA